ncbi:MAG: class I SAM-dependent methyltransferase [Chitinophagaceae bacterium]|nr:class I SAM-dependent methyltransferase [Chitinophagaceae bacterium]
MKITEEEIRPEVVFNEYLKLTTKDTITYFANAQKFDINCPACGENGILWAIKHDFNYKQCPNCKTIFVSPRPVVDAFNAYYTDSPSTKFWATTFYKVTESARREKLWKPKAQTVKDQIITLNGTNPFKYVIDIGGGYGVFDEELKKIMEIETIIIEPSIHLAEICRKKDLQVVEKFMEEICDGDLPEGRKCFVSFELFEHLHDPNIFLQTVFKNMNSNDIFIFTTLSGMGIDIQLLGENSKALSPPHHLNFFNPKSASSLLEKNGFEVLSAITPGKLDIDILTKNLNLIQDPYWKNLLSYLDANELDNLQTKIVEMGMSSHMMITSIKK